MDNSEPSLQQDLSLYIHLPWCLHKCPYCDFNSHATELHAFPEQQYVDSLINDLQHSLELLNRRTIQSIFFGGGTPSLFSPASIDKILTACRRLATLNADCEITLETNPGTFEYQKFAEFLACGVNRLSIGVQSFNDTLLKKLERIHSGKDASKAIETAQTIGFTNINIDLMFGLPEQNCVAASTDIQQACEQHVNHISYYQLTIEPNTIFHRYPPQNLPDENDGWEMQCNAIRHLETAGYHRYEVSAYALENKECRHNLNYWCFGDYLGIGAGAHSKISTTAAIIRHQRTRQPESYIRAVAAGTQVLQERQLTPDELVFEFLLNNLRLYNGFSVSSFTEFTGLPFQTIAQSVNQAVADNLLERQCQQIRATELGYRFLDDLLQRFLPVRA